jgi:hypothetical protein
MQLNTDVKYRLYLATDNDSGHDLLRCLLLVDVAAGENEQIIAIFRPGLCQNCSRSVSFGPFVICQIVPRRALSVSNSD